MQRVLAATWIAKPGCEDRVKDLLRHLAAASSQEPGCLRYIVHQSEHNPAHFLLYEVYRDADALRAHSESPHFKRYVLGEAVALLQSRERLELNIVVDESAKSLHRLQHVSSPFPQEQRESMKSFYGELLGLAEVAAPDSSSPMGLLWFLAGPDLELHFFPGAGDGGSRRHFCLNTDDPAKTRNVLETAGYELFDDTPIPGRPRFFCRDPGGNLVEFTTIESAR
jgi:quinol monooxygenase YgiN/catechol 2,3-dioxygenase-like lactoylglutathione lyase family enzyme